jgi:hypothetical protein
VCASYFFYRQKSNQKGRLGGVINIYCGFRARLAKQYCFCYGRAQKGSVVARNSICFFGDNIVIGFLNRTASELVLASTLYLFPWVTTKIL